MPVSSRIEQPGALAGSVGRVQDESADTAAMSAVAQALLGAKGSLQGEKGVHLPRAV